LFAPSSGLPDSSPRLIGYRILWQVRAEARLRDNGAFEVVVAVNAQRCSRFVTYLLPSL
jgi:hypothetical protein